MELMAPCTSCGASVPVNRPELQSKCGNCLLMTPISDELWRAALGGAQDDFKKLGRGVLKAGKLEQTGADLEWQRGPDRVSCPGCSSAMSWTSAQTLACPNCSAQRQVNPAPEFLASMPVRISGVIADPPSEEPTQKRSIAINCQSCGASLQTDGQARMVPCQFCSTSNVLPDDVWRALHPPKKRRRFWLVCDLDEDPRRAPVASKTSVVGLLIASVLFALIGTVGVLVLGGLTIGLLYAVLGVMTEEQADSALGVVIGVGFVLLTLSAFVKMYRQDVKDIRLMTPDNEVVGRLGAAGETEVQLFRPPNWQTPVGAAKLVLKNEDYANLGGEGGYVRAWVDPQGNTAARALPSSLV